MLSQLSYAPKSCTAPDAQSLSPAQ